MSTNRNFFRWVYLLLVTVLLLPSHVNAEFWNKNKEKTVTITQDEYNRLKQFEKLDEVKQYIDAFYYEEPDQQKLLDGAIQGLLSGLGDAYSFYYNAEAWQKMQEDDSGKYAGIGVQMLGNYEDASVTITRVFRNTPAEEAGLKKGDVFYRVEDLEVNTATMSDAVDIMRGIPGEKVHVEIIRNGEVLPFDLIKANIIVNRVEYKMLDENVGYIILFEFAGGSYNAFKSAFDELKSQGMKYLIFDLRDNPGGWVGDAERIGDMLLDEKLLYYTQDRFNRRKDYITDKGMERIPLIILINGNSASASEILTAAMQDHNRAQIVGVKTFGKGVIQFVVPLSDGTTGFQLTNAQYFSPHGRKVHKEGIQPDIEILMPEELEDKLFDTGDLSDPQLAKAYELALERLK
jgi:carboxyl-terminal processing protease